MITALRKLFLAILLLLLMVGMGIYLLIATEVGTQFTLQTITKLTSIPLTYGQVTGSLIGTFTLNNISYKTSSLSISIDHLAVKWHPLELLHGKILVDNLTLNTALTHISSAAPKKVTQTSQQNIPQKISWPLPFSVQINQLDLKNITVITGDPQQPIHLNSLAGEIKADKFFNADIIADFSSPTVITTHFTIKGNPDAYQFQLSLNNSLSNWLLKGSGNQNSLSLTTEESKLLGGQLSGASKLQWFPELRWDFSMNASAVNLNLISADLPKNLSFSAVSQGSLKAFNLFVTGLQGNLKNYPLQGYLKIISQQQNNPLNITTGHEANLGWWDYFQRRNLNLDAQLQLGTAIANIKGNLTEQWNLQFKLIADELHKLTPELSGNFKLQGIISGDAKRPEINAKISLQQLKFKSLPDAIFQGDLSLLASLAPTNKACELFSNYKNCSISSLIKLTQGQINYKLNNKKINFPVAATLDSRYDPKGLNSSLDLSLYGKKFLGLQLGLPNYKLTFPLPAEQPIYGKLVASLDQNQLSEFLPSDIQATNTALTANIQLSGTINKPNLHGLINLKNDSTAIPAVAIKLMGLNINLILDNDVINYSGGVKSGAGHLQLKGTSLLTNHGLDSNIAITGTAFQVSNTPKMQIVVAPELTILSDSKGWRISGNVLVPSATIKQSDLNQTITLPPETIIIDPEGQIQQSQSLPIDTLVTVELGNNVQIDASGLSGQVVGKLHIVDDSQGTTIGTGTLNLVNASYNLQGEKLAISQGDIIFTNSPIDNPQLDIRAAKKIDYSSQEQIFSQEDNLTVGISVRGTVEDPKITLFSDPTGWSQADILSLILLGQPATMASSSQIQLLARAAQALTSKNGNGINSFTQQLQHFFGLNELDLNSEVNNQSGNYSQSTSVVLGKSLSRRLKLSYSLNVFNSINTLRIRYLLSKHWFVQTESNTMGKGADIIYTVGK